MQLNSFISYNTMTGQVKEVGDTDVIFLDDENNLMSAPIALCDKAERPSYWNSLLDSVEIIS